MPEINKAKEYEDNLRFYEAGLEYFKMASDKAYVQQSPDLFMKAARCFEKADPWRMTYMSWSFCGDSLFSRDLSEDGKTINFESLDFERRFSPYRITDKNWENPEEETYKRVIYRCANENEKNKHQRAWAYDFAGQVASRYHRHANASLRFRQAAKAWMECSNFPNNKLIAAKFFAWATCEAILGINFGQESYENFISYVKEDISSLKAIMLSKTNFLKNNSLKDKAEHFRILAVLFKSIQKYAVDGKFHEITDHCITYENIALKYHHLFSRNYFQFIKSFILWLVTKNGTSYKRFAFFVLILSFVIFPTFYFVADSFNGELISASSGLKATVNEVLYFSFVTLTTLGYGDFYPIGLTRWVAVTEAGTGYLLLGIFVWLLTKKID